MRVLNRAQIEDQILAISERMEETTYAYEQISNEAAEAEADYKLAAAQYSVHLATAGKGTVAQRQAAIDLHCHKQFRQWKIIEAKRQATKEALLSLRARLDALRTLNASVRGQT